MLSQSRSTFRRLTGVCLAACFAMNTETALAALTDLSNSPMVSGITTPSTVKPNIAFVVDDSGSMNDQNMPDPTTTNRNKRCWGWYKYNTLFYNPNQTYKPPYKIDGAVYSDGVTRFPNASFTAALKEGYFPLNGVTFGGGSGSNTAIDLSALSNLTPSAVACQHNVDCPTTATTTKYYYSTHNTNPNSAACDADVSYSIVTSADKIGAPGIPATGRTAAQIQAAKTNYANWYTYYRTRSMLMKAAAGEAFKDLDQSKFRVGLFFLNSGDSGAGESSGINSDLKIADFSGVVDGSQRYEWYELLYGNRSGGWTPLRAALSRMGKMYAGLLSGYDPVQYSCQQNFTLLSTDGYWNANAETSTYGPYKLDGGTVGNQDRAATSAVAARSKITIGPQTGTGADACYQVTSIGVNVAGTTYQLLPDAVPGTCTTQLDGLGQAVRDAVNAGTATHKYSALYGGGVITLIAPVELGAITATPTVSTSKINNTGKSRSFTVTAFSGGAVAVDGTARPYLDALGISNTLADVAYYYYNTDLRDAALGNCSNTIGNTTYTSLCNNNVLGAGKDTNNKQHMTTFTVGLGVSGTLRYEKNYEQAANIVGVNQYVDILNGSLNWPDPLNSNDARIDDLWHAAVNGRGTYYSASDVTTLRESIQSALSGIQARKGSSAAAATSNLEPVAGDNFVYVALYHTQTWAGDLLSFSIDPSTGQLTTSPNWSAKTEIDKQVSTAIAAGNGDGRSIKFFSSGETNKLKDFTFTNLSQDGLQGNFENICNKTTAIEQCGNDANGLDATRKAIANSGENLVNFLRGRPTHEDDTANVVVNNRVYRDRLHVLGDVVNAAPVYMKKPPLSYDKFDASYALFKTANNSRASTVFVAANDGMLHAINAEDGTERWAYVPRFVMPNMWNLADRNYANNHRYFVDGSPTIADICTSLDSGQPMLCSSETKWKTILVGGLNKGGCGFYALDVTDPTNPKGLWEFSHANLGYTYGNPVVGKRASDGKWIIIISSGYNNVPGNGCGNTGDGNGHVFILDAATGQLLEDIPTYTTGTTPAGDQQTPSGLAKLNAWIEDPAAPIIDRVYGGDLLGNVWRIDFDNRYAPNGKEAVRIAQLKDVDDKPQPITTKPELAMIAASGSNFPVVLVGTGKYLGVGDISDISPQSIYALKDSLGEDGISNVRGATMIKRVLTQTSGSTNGSVAGRAIRTISGDSINWGSDDGWYVDFNPSNTSPGERVNVDMSLQFNILTVAANVPATNSCDVAGYAFLYFFDINSGLNLTTAIDGMAGVKLSGNALIAGIKMVKLTTGKTVTIVTDTAGNVGAEDNPSATGGGAGAVRRTTWREILD